MKLYEVLGVKENSSQEDIEKAYKRLAHVHHPDKGGDRENWEQLSFAYNVLGNPTKRQLYDNFGKTEMPKIEAEIQTVLLQAFSQALQNKANNVLDFVRQFISQGKTQITSQKEQAIKEIEDLRQRTSLVETTSEQNLFHLIVDQAIQHRENLIQEAEFKLSVAKGCEAILNTYKSKELVLPKMQRPPGVFQHIFSVSDLDIKRMRAEFDKNWSKPMGGEE